ncbi:haloacid dehalogenase-like hydrolase [Trichlorobacter lovleyi]|uniref:HAD family hydrolase n=1 Tax=Trichlorobacter lovleyi TaxID=313985 RepID=UPI00223F08D1|nr:HAD family hydrolase [Trichlorobacter lovleyi]QOX80482.1 haloacid dehalogenase-like hydrolase [Trichlorobacter lovleyi]
MAKKLIPFAIAYDFDGTLAPGNMQEYDFVPSVGMTKTAFWKEVAELAKEHNADSILMYMMHMLDKAHAAHVPVRKTDFINFGRSVTLFEGVRDWFDRIDKYGKERGLKIEHYIISSGNREMIEGTSIAKKFTAIYASSFVYDHNGVAKWPALAVNYTTKTQFLFRINKGVMNVYDNSKVNEFVPKEDRPVPFKNMVFIGDGDTDIPCFRMVKEQGGHAIAVYKPNTRGTKGKADKLIQEGRVNFIAPANYSENGEIDTVVKAIIDKVAADTALIQLGKRG